MLTIPFTKDMKNFCIERLGQGLDISKPDEEYDHVQLELENFCVDKSGIIIFRIFRKSEERFMINIPFIVKFIKCFLEVRNQIHINTKSICFTKTSFSLSVDIEFDEDSLERIFLNKKKIDVSRRSRSPSSSPDRRHDRRRRSLSRSYTRRRRSPSPDKRRDDRWGRSRSPSPDRRRRPPTSEDIEFFLRRCLEN